ncbi:hypothetical protein MKX01_008702 [Papaver californicum]|nr:hypothetical protein MKX01_008702 [Papaver californicum]
MAASCCKISQHLKNSFHFLLNPFKFVFLNSTSSFLHRRIGFKQPNRLQFLPTAYNQQKDNGEVPLGGDVVSVSGIVALGKFDALHVVHRELAIQESKAGTPFLLSSVGMPEVLGWEPRAHFVAKCYRKQFSSIKHLSPRQFVQKLSKELRVQGVVYGIGANIVSSAMNTSQSPGIRIPTNISSKVCHALVEGDMKCVSELLGSKHRLKFIMLLLKSCLLNLQPKDGSHEDCILWLMTITCYHAEL